MSTKSKRKETKKKKSKQNASSDWLADAAEAYAAYCFSRDKFEVFGAGKWEADLIVRHKKIKGGEWLRVEVKSGHKGRPWKKIAKKAELCAKVQISEEGAIIFELSKLNRRAQTWKTIRGEPSRIEKEGDIVNFLR